MRLCLVVSVLIWLTCWKTCLSHKKKVTDWRKSEILEALACEGESADINCPNYEGIKITSAFWGRDDTLTCQPDDPLAKRSYKETCMPIDKGYALRKVNQVCKSLETCKIFATPTFFDTELCPNVIKYVRIKYECRHMTGMRRSKIQQSSNSET